MWPRRLIPDQLRKQSKEDSLPWRILQRKGFALMEIAVLLGRIVWI
jgi:hypothetical protein